VHPWYYIQAKGDLDGDKTKYTELRTSSGRALIVGYDEGE
jgi:hypothetical protein